MVAKEANHLKKILILKNQLNSRTLETSRSREAVTPYTRLFESSNRKLNSEMFIKRMCCNNKTNYNSSERNGLKTLKCPKQVKELVLFENDLIDMLKVIKFRKVKNQFLTKLKNNITQLSNPKNTNICRQDIEHVPIKQRRT